MGEQSGDILKDQRRMIHSVLDLQNRTVEQVMVPLVDIVAVEKDTDLETFLNFTSESGFSRIPVYDGRIYNIIGIVHLLDVIYSNGDAKTIEPFLRTDLQFIPDSQNINVLLKEIPRSHHTMVFVVDEYGGTIGLVTVEDHYRPSRYRPTLRRMELLVGSNPGVGRPSDRGDMDD